MNIKSIKRSFKRWGESVLNYALVLDTSPGQILQAEIREVRRELTELRRQVDGNPQRLRDVA